MSGNLNKGFELFPFHLVGKFPRTEAKYPLFAPYVFRHFDCHLEGLATKFDVIVPTDSSMLFLFCHLSCNFGITQVQ